MSLTTFVIPDGYGLIILEALLIAFACISQMGPVMMLRDKFFNKAFFDQHFPHLKPYPKQGYPDTGEGRFSDKLTDDQWLQFANAQRAHYNFIEQLASALLSLLVGGLFYPRVCVVAGFAYLVGRVLYGIGYRRSGAKGRAYGVYILDAGILVLFIAAVLGSYNAAGGITGITHFILTIPKL